MGRSVLPPKPRYTKVHRHSCSHSYTSSNTQAGIVPTLTLLRGKLDVYTNTQMGLNAQDSLVGHTQKVPCHLIDHLQWDLFLLLYFI